MSRIRFSDQVHHSNEYGDNYYRNDHSLRTPSDVLHTPNDYIQDDYYSKPGYGENDLLLGSYQGRSYHHHGRPLSRGNARGLRDCPLLPLFGTICDRETPWEIQIVLRRPFSLPPPIRRESQPEP